MTADSGIRTALIVLAVIAVVAATWIAAAVFAPVAFALFVIAIVWPLQSRLQSRLPKLLALAIVVLITVVVCLAFASLIVWGFWRVGRWIVNDAARFQLLYDQMADWLRGTASSWPGCGRITSTSPGWCGRCRR